MELKRIEAYKTSDDQIFESRDDALNHERNFNYIKEVVKLIDGLDVYDPEDLIYNFLIEHPEELQELLNKRNKDDN
jgi:hypothetical protein